MKNILVFIVFLKCIVEQKWVKPLAVCNDSSQKSVTLFSAIIVSLSECNDCFLSLLDLHMFSCFLCISELTSFFLQYIKYVYI